MNKRLKYLRKNILNITQTEISKALGINVSTYSMIESGHRELKDRYIKVLVAEYSVNEQWLRCGVGKAKTLTPKQKELMDSFEQLENETVRMRFLRLAEEMFDIQDDIEVNQKRRVTMLDFPK